MTTVEGVITSWSVDSRFFIKKVLVEAIFADWFIDWYRRFDPGLNIKIKQLTKFFRLW